MHPYQLTYTKGSLYMFGTAAFLLVLVYLMLTYQVRPEYFLPLSLALEFWFILYVSSIRAKAEHEYKLNRDFNYSLGVKDYIEFVYRSPIKTLRSVWLFCVSAHFVSLTIYLIAVVYSYM